MKWINAEQQVTVTLYDEEHEEYFDKVMTVEKMLDKYTNEGCPTMYSNPERKGRWINSYDFRRNHYKRCSECGAYIEAIFFANDYSVNFCPNCGSDNREVE